MSDAHGSDEALMARVAAGDMNALAGLVKRHQVRTLRLAQRLTGDSHAAQDIAQEAFLRVYRSAGGYRPTARFTTWLHRIVVNLYLDDRRRSRRVVSQAVPAQVDESTPAPGTGLVDRELRSAVRSAVLALPARQRLALVLHRFEGHATREIAEITGWSASAVESCLVRAYRQLRTALADYAPAATSNSPQARQPVGVKQKEQP